MVGVDARYAIETVHVSDRYGIAGLCCICGEGGIQDMIDIEADVFAAVKAGLPTGTDCREAYPNTLKKLPLVTVSEIENVTSDRFEDSSGIENASRLTYEINVFTNLEGGKKKQAKTLLHAAHAVMDSLGFERVYCQPTPNLADATVFRMTARYRAIVDRNKIIYRR